MLFRLPQSEDMRRIFSPEHELKWMLRFEAALALSEVRCGLVPECAAKTIGSYCRTDGLDVERIARESTASGNAAIPMVRCLTELVGAKDKQAAGYVHWGATSQDVLDTALALQMREALSLTKRTLNELCDVLASLAQEHAVTVMAGRTWMQQAVPVTFGLKLAEVLDAMLRHRARLIDAARRTLVLQFGGAAGTLAALGEHADAVAEALAKELDLELPAIAWHSHRDRLVEIASVYAAIAVTLGKFARDLALLSQTEVGEIAELESGNSSTMPHKRNPVRLAAVLSLTARVPGLISTLLTAAATQEHERGLSGWQIEWSTFPDVIITVQEALEASIRLLQHMHIDRERMEQNLHMTGGLVLAEAVSMALANHVGKAEAHRLVESVARKSLEQKLDFFDALRKEPSITARISEETLDHLSKPSYYLGNAARTIRRVVEMYRDLRSLSEGEDSNE